MNCYGSRRLFSFSSFIRIIRILPSEVREAMLKTYLDTQLALKGHFQTSDTVMHKTFHLSI